jgi:uncharacterized coiled-coil protein SlyX
MHDCKQETRISTLESATAVNNTNIKNLVDALALLTSEVKTLRITIVNGVGKVLFALFAMLIAIIGFLFKLKMGW